MARTTNTDVLTVLRLLKDRRNVLISGPPGTGKSRLLSQVAQAFISPGVLRGATSAPVHVPGAQVPIPNHAPSGIPPELQDVFPGAARTDRKVFRTTFHQNSKYREFLTGMVPTTAGGGGFRIMEGTLYRASEHSKLRDGAALLIIDEINRGPAVQIFGGSIVAIEADKRLAEDDSQRAETQFFEILDPSTSDLIEYALPHHLYILAAMNQADTSVEPLDVAFLRRWAQFRLSPQGDVLRSFFGLPANESDALPESPQNVEDVYEAAVKSLVAINRRISIGRGPDFQLGHGVFLTGGQAVPKDIGEALNFVAETWNYVRAHVDEVFFGDVRGVAAVLNVVGGPANHRKRSVIPVLPSPR